MANYQTSNGNADQKKADTTDIAAEYIGNVAERVQGVARVAVDQTVDAGERVQAVAGNVKEAVDKSVRDQPMATLAMAAVIGFVLGAVWKS